MCVVLFWLAPKVLGDFGALRSCRDQGWCLGLPASWWGVSGARQSLETDVPTNWVAPNHRHQTISISPNPPFSSYKPHKLSSTHCIGRPSNFTNVWIWFVIFRFFFYVTTDQRCTDTDASVFLFELSPTDAHAHILSFPTTPTSYFRRRLLGAKSASAEPHILPKAWLALPFPCMAPAGGHQAPAPLRAWEPKHLRLHLLLPACPSIYDCISHYSSHVHQHL